LSADAVLTDELADGTSVGSAEPGDVRLTVSSPLAVAGLSEVASRVECSLLAFGVDAFDEATIDASAA
jgi:hypothetical protein